MSSLSNILCMLFLPECHVHNQYSRLCYHMMLTACLGSLFIIVILIEELFKKECCKQCRHVKFKDTMTKWPIHKQTHRTTQKHAEHEDATDILFCCIYNFLNDFILVLALQSQSYRNVADSVKRRTLRCTFILYYFTQRAGGWYYLLSWKIMFLV